MCSFGSSDVRFLHIVGAPVGRFVSRSDLIQARSPSQCYSYGAAENSNGSSSSSGGGEQFIKSVRQSAYIIMLRCSYYFTYL